MADGIDAYKILQVDPEAEDEVIQAAYRRLARKYHPDLTEAEDAERRMAAINAAWELLGTPGSRAAYDHSLGTGLRGRSTADGFGGTAPGAPPSGTPSGAPSGRPSGTPSSRGTGPGTPPRTPPRTPPLRTPPPAETVSRDWTSGRSDHGGGFDESMRAAEGLGAAGPAPGRPSGSVLNFGRYAGWSLGEIARHDLEYIEWLDRAPIGRNFREEVDGILRSAGRRKSADAEATDRRGLFRRR